MNGTSRLLLRLNCDDGKRPNPRPVAPGKGLLVPNGQVTTRLRPRTPSARPTVLTSTYPMNSIRRLFAALAAASAFILMASAASAPETWTALFNGRDLTGWAVPSPNPYWRVENGVLVGESDEKQTGSMLRTEK